MPDGEVVLTVENKSPLHDVFQFQRVNGGLTRAGCYCLQYTLRPELPSGRALRLTVDLEVAAGPAVGFDIQGEGRAIAMSKAVLLGEALPPLQLVLQDSHGNAVPPGPNGAPAITLQVLEAGPGGGGAVLQELEAAADVVGVHPGVSDAAACRGREEGRGIFLLVCIGGRTFKHIAVMLNVRECRCCCCVRVCAGGVP